MIAPSQVSGTNGSGTVVGHACYSGISLEKPWITDCMVCHVCLSTLFLKLLLLQSSSNSVKLDEHIKKSKRFTQGIFIAFHYKLLNLIYKEDCFNYKWTKERFTPCSH